MHTTERGFNYADQEFPTGQREFTRIANYATKQEPVQLPAPALITLGRSSGLLPIPCVQYSLKSLAQILREREGLASRSAASVDGRPSLRCLRDAMAATG
jgi:hypothetical protein